MDKQELIKRIKDATKNLKNKKGSKMIIDIGIDDDLNFKIGNEKIETLYIGTKSSETEDFKYVQFALYLPEGWKYYGFNKDYVTDAGIGLSMTLNILTILYEYTSVPYVLFYTNDYIYIITDSDPLNDDTYTIVMTENNKIKHKYTAICTYEGAKLFASNFKYNTTINNIKNIAN